jgi:hypothetical protein
MNRLRELTAEVGVMPAATDGPDVDGSPYGAPFGPISHPPPAGWAYGCTREQNRDESQCRTTHAARSRPAFSRAALPIRGQVRERCGHTRC